MKIKNPITAIWRSDASRGLKIIAYSLLLVFVTSLPLIAYVIFGPSDGNPIGLGLLFAGGAMVAHVGFFVGLLMLIWDHYFRK
ncbi:hypothetical protein EDC38_0676 [Marinimicrobium koreense]|jgi:hypothetical protein|uniref:Uncharacterized protein n=1 Tax=Marinimicrobium koreense TaxID=306545 RepID=A0A3N1NMM9_9GAMM|nr:hypothetical protein [Marinimicrobium koreense]ROQ20082.1 hypothetical protein EDC38_0676 [Marinimicrobium koreense]